MIGIKTMLLQSEQYIKQLRIRLLQSQQKPGLIRIGPTTSYSKIEAVEPALLLAEEWSETSQPFPAAA